MKSVNIKIPVYPQVEKKVEKEEDDGDNNEDDDDNEVRRMAIYHMTTK